MRGIDGVFGGSGYVEDKRIVAMLQFHLGVVAEIDRLELGKQMLLHFSNWVALRLGSRTGDNVTMGVSDGVREVETIQPV